MIGKILGGARQAGGRQWALICTALAFLLLCMPVLYNYIVWQSVNFIIGCITLPLLLRTNKGSTTSNRYTWVALFFCIMYLLLPVKTCLYVVLAAALLGIWESRYGKTTVMAVLT